MSIANKRTSVNGLEMAYYDQGTGTPLVFLHGNPTSSYLWRNVIASMGDQYRCIAPDLIGMGKSAKLPDSGPESYTFVEHARYLDELFAAILPDEPVTLVIHDWGSALGFHWAQRHLDRVAGVAYMEAIVTPMTWADWPEFAREPFRILRSAGGEEMVLEHNAFVEEILPGAIVRDLTEDEMNVYREPFKDAGEGRRPTLTWPRQIPLDEEPADVCAIIREYGAWLAESELPKLFINAEPGAILTGTQRDFCRSWPNQTEVTVAGAHFIQEDSPKEIAQAVSIWRASF